MGAHVRCQNDRAVVAMVAVDGERLVAFEEYSAPAGASSAEALRDLQIGLHGFLERFAGTPLHLLRTEPGPRAKAQPVRVCMRAEGLLLALSAKHESTVHELAGATVRSAADSSKTSIEAACRRHADKVRDAPAAAHRAIGAALTPPA